MGAVIPISRHRRHRWHDAPPPVVAPVDAAELRAEVDALRAGLASLGRELADVRGELAGQYPSERRGA